MTQETKAEVTPEVTQAEPEKPKTPTVEELTARLAQYEKELTSARNEAKAHQKFGQEKVTELKNQSDLRSEIASIREDLELAVTAFASKPSSDDIVPDNKVVQDTLAELAKKRDAREASRKKEEATKTLNTFQQRVTALGLTEEDETYWDIFRIARTLDPVDLRLADIKLRKLEAQKEQTKAPEVTPERKPEVKPEVPDIQKAIEDGIKAELKRRGLDTSDDGQPVGGNVSAIDAMAKYSRGEITAEQAKKYGVNFD